MSNEETIYECSSDNTRWYGSNQSPEVCPVCKVPGIVSIPQEFQSSDEKEAVAAAIDEIPVAGEEEEVPAETVSDEEAVDPLPEVAVE